MTTIRVTLGLVLAIGLTACSMNKIVVRGAAPMLDGGLIAMNHETDMVLAGNAMPTNLKMLEGMIELDPRNAHLREFASQGFYGYTYGFVDDDDKPRASALYRRGFDHAQQALRTLGFKHDILTTAQQDLEATIAKLDKRALPGLFWGASCLAKWIDMNRTDPAIIAQLGKAAMMMQRVLQLDDTYYYGGAHLFFGVYYGGMAPMYGGNFARSKEQFARAREITGGKLLIGDVLYAQYLARQEQDQQSFHDKLTAVINAPDDLFPEMALANVIAKHKARLYLNFEKEWF